MIRKLKPDDRKKLEFILKKIPAFNHEDTAVALELIDTALFNIEQTDYNIFVYEDAEGLKGYHCTGLRPLTDAVYDLYWIVVDPDEAGRGTGGALLRHSEEFVAAQNGRWLLAETSSGDKYEATRKFYVKNGFEIISEIKHFYNYEESLLVYGKYLWAKK